MVASLAVHPADDSVHRPVVVLAVVVDLHRLRTEEEHRRRRRTGEAEVRPEVDHRRLGDDRRRQEADHRRLSEERPEVHLDE